MGNQYYKKYAKTQQEAKPSYVKLFFGAFFMMLILFVVLAIHLFSSVDTAIGENDEGDLKESGLGVKHLIDSRLKFIQMEDADGGLSNMTPKIIQSKEEEMSMYNNSEDEVQVQSFGGQDYSNPYGKNSTYSQAQTSYPSTTVSTTYPSENTIKRPVGVQQQTKTYTNTVYKVYIGSYSTLEQARVAQSIIQDANLGVASFVKTLANGSYTVQVGSYADMSKAQNLTEELKRNHFPARMIQE